MASEHTDTRAFDARITRRAFVGGAAALALSALGLAGCNAEEGASDVDGSASESGSAASDAASQAADAAAPAADEPVSRSFFAFDSLVSIQAYGATEKVLDQVQQDCTRYEDLFSAHRDGSDIARINAAAGKPVEVDADTADLISAALDLAAEFEGAFDPTIGTVSLLWDFDACVKPADEDIQAALPHIDYRQVSVEGTTVTMGDAQAKLDLGGVAKGWIAERVRQTLADAGVEHALVNLGTSSIWAMGAKPTGEAWRIGLRDPQDSLSSLLGVVSVADAAITSSGLYDRHFEVDGVDYHHILDPATGYPVKTDLLGVTVINGSSLEADAMTTALFVMGADEGRSWLAQNKAGSVEAMFVDASDEPSFTDGFVETYAYQALNASAASSKSGEQ